MSAYSPGERKDIMIHTCVLIIIDSCALIFNLSVIILFFRYHRVLLECINNRFLFSMATADALVAWCIRNTDTNIDVSISGE